MEDVVRALVIAGQGVITRQDALRAGVLDTQVRRALRAGELVQAARGTYAVATDYPTPEAAHAVTAQAVLRRLREGTSVSHYSALACADLPTYGCDLDTVHLSTPRPGGRWRRAGVVVHTLPRGICARDGLVPLPIALVQTGIVAGPTAFVVAADAALRRGAVQAEEIDVALLQMQRTPGIAPVRAAARRLDPRSESVGESVARDLIRNMGWAVEPQYRIGTAGRYYRADLRIDGERVLVEFDGMGKYADRGALAAEKRREADLRAAGWEVVRLVWSDLYDPARVARLVAAAVGRARRAQA